MKRVKVTLKPSGEVIEGEVGDTLMEVLRAEGIPLGSSCNGELVCGYCRLRVLAGADKLSPIDAEEARLLERKRAEPDERMACVALLSGPVTLQADYW